jgi:hypothetical protein
VLPTVASLTEGPYGPSFSFFFSSSEGHSVPQPIYLYIFFYFFLYVLISFLFYFLFYVLWTYKCHVYFLFMATIYKSIG